LFCAVAVSPKMTSAAALRVMRRAGFGIIVVLLACGVAGAAWLWGR
jgi:CBS domain-containing protein